MLAADSENCSSSSSSDDDKEVNDFRVSSVTYIKGDKYNHHDPNVQKLLDMLCPVAAEESLELLIYPDPRAVNFFTKKDLEHVDIEDLPIINAAIAIAMTYHTGRSYVRDGNICTIDGIKTGYKMSCQNKVCFHNFFLLLLF